MSVRTPLTLITGPLGSGKTTLLRHLVATVPHKMAILMNEFGDIAIDSHIIAGKNIRLTELGGGCVCCSLLGEFEAAVQEIIDTVYPDLLVVETTGVAEPDAVMVNIQESVLPVRLDGVITVIDADALVQYPSVGHTSRLQIEAADLILLNKIDLVSAQELTQAREKLAHLNPQAPILSTQRCRVDPDLLFGIGRVGAQHAVPLPPTHIHQPEVASFSYVSDALLQRSCFERFAERLSACVYRAKGFVRFAEGSYLFNFVSGRWELEPWPHERTTLVFIGTHVTEHHNTIRDALRKCEC